MQNPSLKLCDRRLFIKHLLCVCTKTLRNFHPEGLCIIFVFRLVLSASSLLGAILPYELELCKAAVLSGHLLLLKIDNILQDRWKVIVEPCAVVDNDGTLSASCVAHKAAALKERIDVAYY